MAWWWGVRPAGAGGCTAPPQRARQPANQLRSPAGTCALCCTQARQLEGDDSGVQDLRASLASLDARIAEVRAQHDEAHQHSSAADKVQRKQGKDLAAMGRERDECR